MLFLFLLIAPFFERTQQAVKHLRCKQTGSIQHAIIKATLFEEV